MLEWVTIQKMAADSGYSVAALRNKIARGHMHQEVHWRKAPDGRILFNVANFLAWAKQ